MAQNDTHIALIILTTQMCGGGGDYWWKIFFRAKICVPAPLAPTSVLTQNKGPDTEPHFSNPPPLLRRASMSPPPPPPAEQFSGRLVRNPLGRVGLEEMEEADEELASDGMDSAKETDGDSWDTAG